MLLYITHPQLHSLPLLFELKSVTLQWSSHQLPLQPYVMATRVLLDLAMVTFLVLCTTYASSCHRAFAYALLSAWNVFPYPLGLINFSLFFGSQLDSNFLSDVLSDLPDQVTSSYCMLLRTMHLSYVTCIIFTFVRMSDLTPYVP